MCSTPISVSDLSTIFEFSSVSEDSSDGILQDNDGSSSNDRSTEEELNRPLLEDSIKDVVFFDKDIEKWVFDTLSEEKFRMCKWIIDLKRKMDIMTELYRIHDQDDLKYIQEMKKRNLANYEYIYRNLCSIQLLVRRQNSKEKTSFVILFDLNALFKNFNSSIFLEPEIAKKVHEILAEWISGYSFSEEGFHRLTNFLKVYYNAANNDVRTIYKAWKNSIFYSRKSDTELDVERNYIDCIYFSILRNSIDDALSMNLNYLPSLIELGQQNLSALLDLLTKFSIPFSGPFKNVKSIRKPKVQLFISSCNVIDSISNCGLPLYGIFEFRPSCLRMRHDEGIKFLHSLDSMPFWLDHMPPLFGKSFDCLKEHIKTI